MPPAHVADGVALEKLQPVAVAHLGPAPAALAAHVPERDWLCTASSSLVIVSPI